MSKINKIKIRCECGKVNCVPVDDEEIFEVTGRPKNMGGKLCPFCGSEITLYLTINIQKR